MEGVPYRSTMNKKIDKAALAARILGLEGISSEDKSALLELLSERSYGLYWENSSEEVEALLREKLPVLTEDTTKRILADATDEVPNHILIEGDNYPALVALQYAYEGKVDVIYIDPPYNTGNKDFVYNDSYVDSEDSYRHSKWLSFMSKRLRIAKRLLSDRGVIFISIDDNEQANLKLLCDEVFGGEQYVDTFIRLTTKSGKTPVDFMRSHEYALCYAKHNNIFKGVAFEDSSYKYEDEFVQKRGRYNLKQPLDCNSISYSKSLDYIIEHDGKIFYPGGDEKKYIARKNGGYLAKDYAWRWSKELFQFGLKNGWIAFKNGRIYTKGYLNATIEKRGDTYEIVYTEKERKRSTIDFVDNEYSNDIAKKQLAYLNLGSQFDFPKPYNFVSDLIATHRDSNVTVLDFFAGSGTTLHATMQLNAEDGGHRQCILVTNNENNICEEVTYERNKRVIQGYTTPKGQQVEGLKNNNLRYYKVDFVDREKTAANQKELMKASTDLLCIKENLYLEETCFEGLKLHPQIARYFTDGKEDGGQMLIIYEPNAIPVIVKRIEQMPVGKENKLKVYVMAEGQYPYTEDFETVLSKVELRAMPHALYQAMRQVLPPPAESENTEPDMEVSDEEADGSIYKSEEQ